jgi:hypothetical protein
MTVTASNPVKPKSPKITESYIQRNIAKPIQKHIQNLTTPQWLKVGLYGTWGASLLLLISAIAGIQAQRHGIQAVAQDAIPNVILAQRLKTAMTDIDSMVANRLVGELLGAGQEAYYQRQGDLSERIMRAAQNAASHEEQLVLQSLMRNFNTYTVQAEQARFAKQRGDKRGMLEAYRQAAAILDNNLLPIADRLAQINETALQISYQQAQNRAKWSLSLILLSGLGLVGSLVALQVLLSRRTRRQLNPMLVGATVLAIGLVSHTLILMSSAAQLRVLKEDAYESLRALRIGRVHLYQANGAKSRYLLDPALAAQYELAFQHQTEEILKLPNSITLAMVIEAYRTGTPIPGVAGEFAEALNHVSFAGEQKVLIRMLEDYAEYLQINQQIRQLAARGQTQAAIDLSIGGNPGQSYGAFKQLRDANEAAIEINTQVFERLTAKTIRSLDNFELQAAITVTLIALMILLGLRPRLREYFI